MKVGSVLEGPAAVSGGNRSILRYDSGYFTRNFDVGIHIYYFSLSVS